MVARAADRPWRSSGADLVVRVQLTPRANRDAIDGIVELPDGPALKVRVRAIPEAGKANAALEALLAAELDVPRRAIAVTSGLTSRVKCVTISGFNAAVLLKFEGRCA